MKHRVRTFYPIPFFLFAEIISLLFYFILTCTLRVCGREVPPMPGEGFSSACPNVRKPPPLKVGSSVYCINVPFFKQNCMTFGETNWSRSDIRGGRRGASFEIRCKIYRMWLKSQLDTGVKFQKSIWYFSWPCCSTGRTESEKQHKSQLHVVVSAGCRIFHGEIDERST